MSKAGKRLIAGAKEAVAYVRGESECKEHHVPVKAGKAQRFFPGAPERSGAPGVLFCSGLMSKTRFR